MNERIASARPARRTTPSVRIRRIRAAGLLVVGAAIASTLVYQSLASSSTALSPVDAPPADHRGASGEGAVPPREHRRALGEADGAVPRGTSVFDDGVPGVANLEPALLDALRRAAIAATSDGVVFVVDSGWRSPAYQAHLLREAVSEYGSEEEAARWVATPTTSAHVSGDAVDIGPREAAAWLSDHGTAYGLCQIYRNEPWHFELRPEASTRGCPDMYADAAHDPRMQH